MKQAILTFTLVSPFMTGANEAASFGIDEKMLIEDNKAIIPSTLLRGVLRDALETIDARQNYENKALITQLFGPSTKEVKEPGKDKDNGSTGAQAQRGTLYFKDCRSTQNTKENILNTRIKIDPETGAVQEGMLQVSALPFEIGEKVEFTTVLYLKKVLYLENDNEGKIKPLLVQALGVISAIGGQKSAGFGRFLYANLSDFEDMAQAPMPLKTKSHILGFTLTPKGAFIVNAQRKGENISESSVDISGAAVLGAIADLLGSQAIDDLAADILVTEARVDLHKRSPIAFSQVYQDKEMPACVNLIHLAPSETPFLYAEKQAPKFVNDVKKADEDAVYGALGFLKKEAFSFSIRTRTAIDYDSGTAYYKEDAGAVFLYKMVEPKGQAWHFELRGGARLQEFAEKINCLTVFIGKTNTPALIEFKKEVSPTSQDFADEVIIKLETEALMPALPHAEHALKDAYEAYFKAYLGAGAELVTFFARQKYMGGWPAKRARGEVYAPLFVTLRGSVFRLKLDEKAKEKLQDLLINGLPEEGLVGLERKNHPLARLNGFGQISVENVKAQSHAD
jgi:RAMP superfamily